MEILPQRDDKKYIFFKSTKVLVIMNPFLSVSDSSCIKGGAGDSQSPSVRRIENKFSIQRQFSSKRLNIVATRISLLV